MYSKRNLREGMHVFSSDGEKLGKVVRLGDDGFLIEKGLFFKENYTGRYEDIARLQGDDLILAPSKSQLLSGEYASGEYASGGYGSGRPAASTSDEVRMPLTEEEPLAVKRQREAGAVHVRKDVVTEQKQINVPVTKEEVHVERHPVGEPAKPGEATFQEEEFTVPVMEEEVEITKRPVVREEVRVGKTRREEVRSASTQVRREEADIEEEHEGHRTPRSPEDDERTKRKL